MKQISPYSKKMWTIDGLITTGIVFIIAIALNIFLDFNTLWKYVLTCSIYGLALLILINAVTMPKYRYKNFRYDMNEESITLKYGVFTQKTVVIPMKRVQFIDTEQGIILRKHKLINLTIHTAGGHYVIPYLENEVGNELQLSIAKIVQERSI